MYARHEGSHTFAIAGVGFSGNALFCQLVDHLIDNPLPDLPVTIKLFEKNPELLATGIPYQTSLPAIWTLTNAANTIRLTPNGEIFANWMSQNPEKWQAQFSNVDAVYPPRALLGIFLKDQYLKYKTKAIAHGILIEEIFEELIDVDNYDSTWELRTANNSTHIANTLFLSLGHAPSDRYQHLKLLPKYFDLTSSTALPEIPTNADVHILGGQLTFVDIALWLFYNKQHKGKIHTLTRNPSRMTAKTNKCEFNTSAAVELENMLKTQFSPNEMTLVQGKHLLWSTYTKYARNPVNTDRQPTTKQALTYQLTKLDGHPVDDTQLGNIDELRSFVATFRMTNCFSEFWDKLQRDDKPEFINTLFSNLLSYTIGLTPINARLLLELYNRDLIVERSGLSHISYDDRNNVFVIHFTDGSTNTAEYLMNASGLGYDISKFNPAFPLLNNLVTKGYVTAKEFGGVMVTDSCQAINRNGSVQTNLFLVGPTVTYNRTNPAQFGTEHAFNMIKSVFSKLEILAPSLNSVSFGL